MTSTGAKLGSVPRTPSQQGMYVVPVLEPRVLPQTQAGFASWSGPALCTETSRIWKSTAKEEFVGRTGHIEVEAPTASLITDEAEHHAVHRTISTGARAVNRLWLSLWFLLLPMIWPSSDWIGLIIISQAFFVAANLIRPAITSNPAAVLPQGEVLSINDGDGSGKG